MASSVFQIMSDLHLETHSSYDHFKLQQTAPNLALLGDIGHIGDERLFAFLEKQLERYWVVYFLLGNHEPYHMSLAIAKAKVNTFAEKMARLNTKSTMRKFVFLDQTRHDLTGKLTILGCTLFSKITDDQEDDVAARLVDFKDILRWTVEDHTFLINPISNGSTTKLRKENEKSRSGRLSSSHITARVVTRGLTVPNIREAKSVQAS
jgi:UDP-2,3-diacylglucosamine pyrophosphatase LpxH